MNRSVGSLPRFSIPVTGTFTARLNPRTYNDPSCEWVDRAPSIVWEFFAADPVYSPDKLERVLGASYDFAKTHFVLDDDPASSSLGYFLTGKMPALMKAKGDELGGMERLFSRLERDVADPSSVRYLEAQYYLRGIRESQSQRAVFVQKAIEALADLEKQGRGLYHRKALATLAALRFAERDFVKACPDLVKYFQTYPDSDWAWVARLRAGLCLLELGNMEAAAISLEAAAKPASNPVARVLGHAYAARGYEGEGRFEIALREYRDALNARDEDYGPTYSLYLHRAPRPTDPPWSDDAEVIKRALPGRIAQLEHSLAAPGGAVLERGRWLLGQGRRQDAIRVLEPLLARRPPAAAATEGRYLTHRAQLETALELADDDRGPDDASALDALERLAREPVDFAVTAGTIAKACILWKKGLSGAESSMAQALHEWHAQQGMTKAGSPLEQDVAAIRPWCFDQREVPCSGTPVNGTRSHGPSRRHPSRLSIPTCA